MRNVAKKVMSLCLTVLVMTSMFVVGGVTVSAEAAAPVNLLAGLTAESISPFNDNLKELAHTTLLTDGKYNESSGTNKWYVHWAPNDGSYVQYALTEATELNTIVIYAGQRNSNNYQDLIKSDEVTISYDSGDGTWRNVTKVVADDKRQDTTPPQVLTFRFDAVTVSKIKIFIKNSAAFRMMEVEAYNIPVPAANKLYGLTAESISPFNDNLKELAHTTLLTDGKYNESSGTNKWYVHWAPTAGSHVQYALTPATELNTVVIYAGMLNGSNTQDLIKADEVTISYDTGDGTWRNVTNVVADDKRQDKTPPQVLTFRFDTVTASKIKIFIKNSDAFRMMEIEAYNNIAPEYSDANGNPIESYRPGDTVVCKIKLGEMDNLLFVMAVKDQKPKLHVVDIGEYIGDGYWKATVTIPEDIETPYIECFAWEKDTLKPIRAMMEF